MSTYEISSILERQLLLQLGDRLRRLRKAQGLGTVEVAAMARLTRNTLRSIEAGDTSPSIGAYVRVMSVLGVSGELALLAGDTMQTAPSGSAGARSRHAEPKVQVHILANNQGHELQDLQSLALHEEAVQLVKSSPELAIQTQETLSRWLATGDPRSSILWREWQTILKVGSWRKVLGRTRHAQQLRQTSPLVTILPEEVRQRILQEVKQLKKGVVIDSSPTNIESAKNFQESQ
jgi:transcriptional regulator with XRE-family HTH domain